MSHSQGPKRSIGLRWGGGFLGLSLALLALVADSLGISSAGFSTGQLFLLLIGLAILIMSFLGARIVATYQTLAILLLNTIVFIIMVEIFFGGVAWLISSDDSEGEDPLLGQFLALPYYQTQAWGASYWQEDKIARAMTFSPYINTKNLPFSGQYINITPEGYRATVGAECTPGSYQIMMFGGSTMFGTGAPDWGTIPSYLQEALAQESERPICVVNYGQLAHMNDQLMIALFFEIKLGQQPDLVIFYAGINDVYFPYKNGTLDTRQTFSELAQRFNPPVPALDQQLLDTIRDHSYTYQVLSRFVEPQEAPIDYSAQEDELFLARELQVDSFAQAITDQMEWQYTTLQQWGRDSGFEVLFFWQPILITSQKTLTPDEERFREQFSPTLTEAYRAVYTRMGALSFPDLHDISTIFDDYEGFIWIDRFHIVPEGNQRVAQAMLPYALEKLESAD